MFASHIHTHMNTARTWMWAQFYFTSSSKSIPMMVCSLAVQCSVWFFFLLVFFFSFSIQANNIRRNARGYLHSMLTIYNVKREREREEKRSFRWDVRQMHSLYGLCAMELTIFIHIFFLLWLHVAFLSSLCYRLWSFMWENSALVVAKIIMETVVEWMHEKKKTNFGKFEHLNLHIAMASKTCTENRIRYEHFQNIHLAKSSTARTTNRFSPLFSICVFFSSFVSFFDEIFRYHIKQLQCAIGKKETEEHFI